MPRLQDTQARRLGATGAEMFREKIGGRVVLRMSDAMVKSVDDLGLERAAAIRLLVGLGFQRLTEDADLAGVTPAVWAAKLAKG